MPNKKTFTPEMTERQYKTLRKLLSLWIAVVVRRRYTIFQNVLLLISLFLNFWLFFHKSSDIQPTMASTVLSQGVNIQQAFDYNNYQSISEPSKNIMTKYTKLYKTYLDNKSQPDRYYYHKDGQVDTEWSRHCRRQLVKIINIKARIRMIENLLINTYPDRIDEIDQASNKGEEALADMSNYYSKFLPTEVYDYIIKTYE